MIIAATIATSDQVLALAADPSSFLHDDETSRLSAYRHEQAAKDFLAGRVLARSLLRKLTGRPISALSFLIDDSRKPKLVDMSIGHFNLSHSRGWIAAVAADRPVGIDIETAESADWRLVARRVFPAAEAERLTALPETQGRLAFCRSWSYKEALIKAAGRDSGILPEQPFAFDLGVPTWQPATPPYGGNFTFALTLSHGAGHIAIAGPRPETPPELLPLEAVMSR